MKCQKKVQNYLGVKSMKAPFIICADTECLLEKVDACSNDPSKLSTEKKNEHEMCGYSLFTNCSFDEKNNKLNYYRGKDCLKKFCQDLRKQAESIINFEKKEMIELAPEEVYKHYIEKYCFICKKPFSKDNNNEYKEKNYDKVRDHCYYTGKYRGAAHRICNLMYNTPREIPFVFHNGSNYDHHFKIKGLVEEFEGDFQCLGENKEKYITFSVPIKKESIKKEYNDNETIIYRIKFIDSFRFMSTSLSTLVDNLSDRIHVKHKCDSCGFNIEYIRKKKSGKPLFKCFNCKRKYFEEFDEELMAKFKNTYRFCNGNIDRFMLLLRKGIYPYKYMDDWDRFNEEILPHKSDFYSSLNMEEILEIDYRHAEKVFNKFNIKNLGEHRDLYVQSDTLLLADVFESFRNLCIKTYKLDPAYFYSLPGLAWEACLKKTGEKLVLISDIDMLLMLEEGIKGGICHSVLKHAKAIINI